MSDQPPVDDLLITDRYPQRYIDITAAAFGYHTLKMAWIVGTFYVHETLGKDLGAGWTVSQRKGRIYEAVQSDYETPQAAIRIAERLNNEVPKRWFKLGDALPANKKQMLRYILESEPINRGGPKG